jgi:hypothetical protein
MSKNSTNSWGWFNIIETSVQDAATCLPPSPHLLESVVRIKSPSQREPKRSPGTGLDDVKATIVKEIVLAHLDFAKVFEICTDASTKQLGSVITQSNRLLAFSVGTYLYNKKSGHSGNTQRVQRDAMGSTY